MDFDTFKDELAKGVQERLETLYDRKYSVETHTVEKMNETYEAITVKIDAEGLLKKYLTPELYEILIA